MNTNHNNKKEKDMNTNQDKEKEMKIPEHTDNEFVYCECPNCDPDQYRFASHEEYMYFKYGIGNVITSEESLGY